MNDNKINVEKLTKPIQLLAAWLVGLLSISSSFLVAAANIKVEWQSGVLVIAAVINVPLFLLAVFILQTKFRPELQEDSYYSTYLSSKTNTLITVNKSENLLNELSIKVERLIKLGSPIDVDLVGFENVQFGINVKLADHDQIKLILSEKAVLGMSFFGEHTSNLSFRVMSISIYLPSPVQHQLIELAKEIGMDGYSLFDNKGEGTTEDVLIGAYGQVEYVLTK